MKICLSLILVFVFSYAYPQSIKSEIKVATPQKWDKTQSEYFILGTLSDYMGRQTVATSSNTLDSYDRLQGPLAETVKNYSNNGRSK